MDILDRIKVFKLAEKEIKQVIKNYVQDKTIPLETRWEVFIKGELGEHDNYYHEPDGIDWGKNTLYDNFYMDKYAVTTAARFIEIVKDNAEKKGYDVDAVKEYFLDNFLWSFENYW